MDKCKHYPHFLMGDNPGRDKSNNIVWKVTFWIWHLLPKSLCSPSWKKKVKKPRNNPYHQTCRFYLEKSTVKANFNSIALIASFQGLKQATSELDLAVKQVLLGLCYILKFIKFQIRFFIFGLFKKFRRSDDAGSIFFFYFQHLILLLVSSIQCIG